MYVRKVENGFLCKLEKGEAVMQTLADFCKERGIQAGWLNALGAVNNAEIGLYDLPSREYIFKTFADDREVVSMMGNVALVEGEPFIHAHIALGDAQMQLVGGHLKEAQVAVTLEVMLRVYGGAIERKLDHDIGLKLLNFS